MSYDIEKLVEKIREKNGGSSGPGPSKDLLRFVEALEEFARISREKGIEKLPFSTSVLGIADLLGQKKSRNRIFQIGKTAVKYVDGLRLEKIDNRLWLFFD